MPKRSKPIEIAQAPVGEPEDSPLPAQEITMQVNPDIVMRRVAMLILAMSSFHPIELDLTAQFFRQNETRAKLDPNVPPEVVRTIGYNARVVGAVAGFQKHLQELEQDALRASQESTVLRGPLVFPSGRPS